MFYSLTGKIIYKDEQSVALLVGGVGFKCFTTRSTLAKINASNNHEETLFTYLNVREADITLKNDILPMNGSATVLKQIAARLPFSSQVISSSPLGAGASFVIPLRRKSTASVV